VVKAGQAVLSPEHPFIERVAGEIRRVYGRRLRSIALFGSVARRSARPNSDVDLFVVVEDLPRGRFARSETFDPVERALAPDIAVLKQNGIDTEVSVVLRTPVDLQTASPLMLDLTEDAFIIEDQGGVLAAALEDLRQRLRRLGSRRIWRGTTWYWDLKPDYKRGEIIRL
jgi:predicted nucleotidyltransferase